MPSRFLEPPITTEEKAAADRVLRADRDLGFGEDLTFEIRAAVAAETALRAQERDAMQAEIDHLRRERLEWQHEVFGIAGEGEGEPVHVATRLQGVRDAETARCAALARSMLSVTVPEPRW